MVSRVTLGAQATAFHRAILTGHEHDNTSFDPVPTLEQKCKVFNRVYSTLGKIRKENPTRENCFSGRPEELEKPERLLICTFNEAICEVLIPTRSNSIHPENRGRRKPL